MKSLWLIIPAFLILAVTPAHAEVFKWRDADTKLILTFPDDWRAVHSQQPDDIITLAAPGADNGAGCRMRVRADKRFLVYPRHYADEIQRTNYSRKFWDDYVGEFNGAIVYSVGDNRGLGAGFASQADISFKTDAPGAPQKRAMIFASVYNDKAYILECSADEGRYAQFQDAFTGILKSVEFRQQYSSYPQGYYRNFTNDPPLYIHNEKPSDLYVY
ncbi:MAG: hypothetical protein ACT4OY_04715 [Alphaproteobacteria bacterium]